MTRLLLALTLCLMGSTLTAQILINEISAANMSGLLDGDGDREDWVELYNPGPAAVNIGGWFLSDNPNNPQKWVIPVGQNIPAGAYRVVFCSGKDKVAPPYLHTNFKLSQTKGESLILTRNNGVLSDSYTFDIPNQVNHSYGRTPNAGPNWNIYTTPTPGAANNSGAFTAYGPEVLADLDAGFYSGGITVNLSTDPAFTIRYTLNGSEPNITSPVYLAPINIAATTVLKARSFSANAQILPGFVTFNTYFINASHTIPVISISGNNVANLFNGNQSAPFGAFEYFEDGMFEEESYGELNKHGNDSWAYQQRGVDWITRDQMGYKDELKEKFFKERTRNKFQRLILKAAANDNYPAAGGAHIRDSYVHTLAMRSGMELDVRTHRSCVMYVNGQYWGVYDIREKVDDADFTSYYYDQDELDIDYIKTWGATWTEYGTSTDWYTLKAFILGNNMAIPANYDQVGQQLEFLSLIDYVIINQHSVCKDWLNWNTSWWRGRNPSGGAQKWRYSLWDMDATFGHYVNYTGIPNEGPTADPCDVEQIPNSGDPQNHIDIFTALYANPEFKALYVNRYADLLNTTLSCAYMNALLDSMTNIIAPEMAQHCNRWGGTVAGWNQNIAALHDFINTRCQVLEPAIVDCYDVTGPFELSVKVSPAASPNQVMVNTITPTSYPYVGNYFGDLDIDLLAQPAVGWLFDHWEVMGNTFGPNQLSAAITLAFETNGMVTAFFVPTGPCTEPTGLMASGTLGTTSVSWTAPPFASSYTVQYREVGTPAWTQFNTTQTTWNIDTLPGCGDYEMQVQTVCPQGNSAFVDFSFSTPNQLLGFAVPDALICNTNSVALDASVAGASYQWDDGSTSPTLNVNSPGTYWVDIQLNGCSVTDTIVVTQINATASIQPELCPGESYVLGTQTFDALNPSGQVILSNMAMSGCDSIVNISLQFLQVSQNLVSTTTCDPAAVGVDTVVLSNAVGCDSLIITATTLVPFSQTLLSAVSCDPAAIGVDTVTLFNAAGCDSLVITTTSLVTFNETFLAASSCNPNLVGVDTVLLANQFGCDSLVITNTAFDPAAISVTALSTQNCDPAAVGVDTVLLTTLAGCDSLVITTTSLAPMSQTLLSATSCNPNALGVDTLILSNQFGCDSLVITTTTFAPTGISVTPLFVQNCDPAAVGVDTTLFINVMGCDSLVITTTSLAPMSQTLLSATSCNPNALGVDTLILSNQFGCDSLVITTTVFAATGISVTPLFIQNCDPAAIGVDTIILSNITGCDSLVITTTSLAPTSQTMLSATSCNPSLAGTDTLTLSNQFGCDSLVITTTLFDPSSISITTFSVQNCDPAAVGVDTLILSSLAGCDSLIVTTTNLAPMSQTFLSANSCDPGLAGIDTLTYSNILGCDSLVITTVTYTGLDFDATAQNVLCFSGNDGFITLDTIFSSLLPVEIQLGNQAVQFYTGTPLLWDELPAGSYSLLATNAEGCTVTQEITVEEANALHLDLGQQPVLIHFGDSLKVEPIADFPIVTAEWSPVEGVLCPSCPTTSIAAQKSGTYTLTAFDGNGCSTSASLNIQVEEGIRVYVPNAMHLGSSDINAQLTIFAGPEVARIRSLQVYDRWGNQLFEQRDLLPNSPSNWDGTFRGKAVNPGVLIWVCEVETIDNQVIRKTGDITVIR
jgi:hypothetical protein